MEKRKNILLAAISVSLFICTHSVKAAEVSNWTELQQAIQNGTSPIDITGNITRNTDMSLGNLGGSNVTINGNGYDIDGADKPGSDAIYGPISVNNGQTLTINNVGSDNTTGFSNFRAIYGGVIELQMTSNSNLTINNSVFSDNIGTDWGGVIQSNGENNIVSIVGSKFINNSAGFGGVISAHNGKSSVTIVDSEFLGNGSSNEGGAICNVGSTVNIIADKADTVFTGNTQRGSISNALENFRLNSNIGRSTMNLNAGEHSVIINDGITGSDAASSTYNINSSGIKMPDGTNAPNTGVVELNNTATNSKVNLYNGTLKLGHYEGGTITKSDGTQTQVAASVGNLDSSINFNANGGKLSVENDGVTTQNLGNVTLNSDLSTEIALDTIGSNSLLSADSVNANNHKIIISDINVGSSDSLVSNKVITTDTDLLGNIAVSDNVTVSGDNLEGKNILLGYTLDNTQLLLSAGASTLAQAVQDTMAERIYTMSEDENVTTNLGTMGGGSGATLTINGGGHDINGNNNAGITVNNGQSLNVNNVGSDGTKGFNGFSYDYGGAIVNQGTATITDSTFSGNSASMFGGVVVNQGTATITSSTFTGNETKSGGVIYNQGGTVTITGSTFSGNSADENGGAILNYGTETITGSAFTGNKAGNTGGVILNHGITTITGSDFSGNSADNTGGAIENFGAVNIIADSTDTTFTGNTANGVSNALYNISLSSGGSGGITNLNAGSAKIVFNDGIDGRDGTININNTGIKLADGTTDAPTNGTVELNNTVKNNTVNLYNGTLKLGHYEGGTIDVNGTPTQVAASSGNFDSSVDFNVKGGSLTLQDEGARTTNLGNITLENDLQLAIDADLANSQSDMITGTVVNANDHNIIISNLNILSDSTVSILETQVADDNLKSVVELATDAAVTHASGVNKNYMLSYDNTDGMLTFNSLVDLKAAVDATDSDRVYSMSADENVTTNLGEMGGGEGATLTINGNGHDITANSDGISGIIINNNQTLNINNVGNKNDEESQGINNFSYMTIINDNGGSLNIDNSVLKNNIAAKDDFAGAINNHGTTVISNTLIEGNKAPTVGAVGNYGTMTIIDSEFRDNSATLSAASLSVGAIGNTSILNIIANDANTTFTGNKNAKNEFNALNNQGGSVNINAGSGKVVFDDSIDGLNGTINVNAGSDVTGINAPTTGTIAINNEVKNNTVNMYNGTLNFGTNTQNGTLYSGNFADSVNFNYNGGTVSLQNSAINSANLGNLTLNSDMDLRLDANLADQTMDTITASSFNANGNNINISNILITQPTTEKTFSISPLGTGMDEAVKTALAGAIQYTGGDIAYSPIYKYSASYDPVSAMMNFGLYGAGRGGEPGYDSFTPDVMASPVAAQLGGYLVQLNSYDNAFRNMDMYMLMTKEQRQAMKMRNRYAAGNDADIVYDPTVTQYENKAGWFRPYATFENVPLNNGPDVSNVSYGSFFGGESELYDLGHGWDGMWGIYAGYNGSHQAYDGVSIWQNGGTLGAVGMAYKGNFFTGLTANVGASAGEASAMFGSEDFTMLMSGIASKTGYNWELAKGKFIIQPSLLMSYSFINTFDYHNAAGVSINSDPLHAIQLEPGIKFIGNLKNGWQPYLGVSVVWNIMDRTQFQANNVSLPSLSIDPFVKYGVGVRKAWGEKFTGFFQTYITNGGRNGVGLQAGFRWTLGKSNSKKQKAKNHTPELPKAKVTLKSMSMK